MYCKNRIIAIVLTRSDLSQVDVLAICFTV